MDDSRSDGRRGHAIDTGAWGGFGRNGAGFHPTRSPRRVNSGESRPPCGKAGCVPAGRGAAKKHRPVAGAAGRCVVSNLSRIATVWSRCETSGDRVLAGRLPVRIAAHAVEWSSAGIGCEWFVETSHCSARISVPWLMRETSTGVSSADCDAGSQYFVEIRGSADGRGRRAKTVGGELGGVNRRF
jgi:hypothetical protein